MKSPAHVTQTLQARGLNAMVLPAHVAPADLATWLAGVSVARNVDGLIVTVPHKFASVAACAGLSERSAFLQAVNMLRRQPDGSWYGDMSDGEGFVAALREQGCVPAGRRCLLVGAGGAGSAIAHALVMAGAAELAIHDGDAQRRGSLVDRLAGLGLCPVRAGSADPRGFDVVVNATPAGMQADDPLPVDVTGLNAAMVVGCVITAPAVTPLIAAARTQGCVTLTGGDMFARVRDLMVEFLLAPAGSRPCA